jgi:hypothetical protein
MTPLIVVVGREGGGSKDEMLGASVAQSSQQAPFTSENVSSIPARWTHAKRVGQRSAESRALSPSAPVSSHRESCQGGLG